MEKVEVPIKVREKALDDQAVSPQSTLLPTILRIKRKKVSVHTDEGEELHSPNPKNFCILTPKKKIRFSQETRVFTFYKTVEAAGGADVDAVTTSEGNKSSSSTAPPPSTNQQLQQHRSPIKKAHRYPSSMDQIKQVLSTKMIQKAKDTRYRLRDEKRKQQMIHDGVVYNVVDIERDDGLDPLTRSLEAMTHEFLNINDSDADNSPKRHDDDDEDVLYDLYTYNHNVPLADVLNSGLVGTLEMDDDTLYLDDDPTASDIGSDSDSNAEDYYTHDYPEEECSDDDNIRYPRIYAESIGEESNTSY